MYVHGFSFHSSSLFCALVFLLFLCGVHGISAENSLSSRFPFAWDFLWTGSWDNSIKTPDGEIQDEGGLFSGGTLYNRMNFNLRLPEISFRFLATDKRLIPLTEDDNKAGFNPAFGIYHQASGSRLLYGVQNDYGLPARLSNVWLRSVPYMESRSPSSRDLKTEPAAKDTAQAYLYLSTPDSFLINAFVSAALDDELIPSFGAGAEYAGLKTEIRLEGFYTARELPPRNVSTWFSSAPPLPERDFRISALGIIFNSPDFAFASDWAVSETFAWGLGVYGNFALRIGNKPWRFSLSGDGAGDRFVDRSGSAAGAGFRLAARAERFWTRSGLLRIQGAFRSPAPDEVFNRGNVSVYFRPSAPTAAAIRLAAERHWLLPIRFTRTSIYMNRDARNPEKTSDVLDVLFGYALGPINGTFSCSLHSISHLDSPVPLFEFPFFEEFDSFKISGEINFKPGIFDIKTRMGYTIRAEKDPILDFSFNVSVKPANWGRIGFKIASTDFPEKWNYTLSWRYEYAAKAGSQRQ